MSKGEDTRQRMIGYAAAAIEARGPSGIGINEVLQGSGTPRGSLYFHFPGGKDELVEASLRHSAAGVEGMVTEALSGGGGGAADSFVRLLDALARRQEEAGFAAGCPVASVALDTAADSPLGLVCDELYGTWEKALADFLAADGYQNASSLATQILAVVEGALLLGRVRRSRAPMDAASAAVRTLLDRS
jgi:TetR/AcrR family transcriptional repressor of lmrAB and yxaGH operons